MRITDYATRQSLNDVCLSLTTEEARELIAYLNRLISTPELGVAHLSEVQGHGISRELTVRVEPYRVARPFSPARAKYAAGY